MTAATEAQLEETVHQELVTAEEWKEKARKARRDSDDVLAAEYIECAEQCKMQSDHAQKQLDEMRKTNE